MKFLAHLFGYKKEIVAVSLPKTFNYHYSDSKQRNYYPITLFLDTKGVRSYYRKLDKFTESLIGVDTYLEYWVASGTMRPEYEVFFDWKVTPRQLKQRYLADLIKE